VLKDGQAAIVLKVFVQPHSVPGLSQDACQRGLAHFDGLAAKVRAVQL
jgi:hypothetical protein